jgi:pimeloyl-ACP methyl ester carboxylesterase
LQQCARGLALARDAHGFDRYACVWRIRLRLTYASAMRNTLRTFLLLVLVIAPASSWAAAKLEQFTVMADGHPLALWARQVSRPQGVILLIHGRTWSSLPDFDLQVPGERRSVMQALNEKRYSAFALDLRGYGKSPRDATSWITPDRAARDVSAALEWLARETNLTRAAARLVAGIAGLALGGAAFAAPDLESRALRISAQPDCAGYR